MTSNLILIGLAGLITSSGVIASGLNNSHLYQGFKIKKTNPVVNNKIVVHKVGDYQFSFDAVLSNSTYNGFQGFINQINVPIYSYNNHGWGLYFMQWLDDDDFNYPFPGLNSSTKHGYWNMPMTWAARLETQMGHFGSFLEDKSYTAFYMTKAYNDWVNFSINAVNAWNIAMASAEGTTGITFSFSFTYNPNNFDYTAKTPSFTIMH